MLYGSANPEISEGFTVAPEVVYWPIVPLKSSVTNRFDPDTAMPSGRPNPEISEGFTVAPEVVYSPIVPPAFVTNRFDPDTAMPNGPKLPNPVISEGFTVAPESVYSPIVPLELFVSKMLSPRAVAGMAKIAAATESAATAHRPAAGTVSRVRCNEPMAFLPSQQRLPGSRARRSSPSRRQPPTCARRGSSQSAPRVA